LIFYVDVAVFVK